MNTNWNFDYFKKRSNILNLNKRSIYQYLLTFEKEPVITNYNVDDIITLINSGYNPLHYSNLLFEISKQYLNKKVVVSPINNEIPINELVNLVIEYYSSYENKILYNELIYNILNNCVSIHTDNYKREFTGQMIPVNNHEKYIYLYRTNTVNDLFTLIHEFRHLTDYNLFYKLKELNPLVTELYAMDYYKNKYSLEESINLFQSGLVNISKKYYFSHKIYHETRYMDSFTLKKYLTRIMLIYNICENELYKLLKDIDTYKDTMYSYLLAACLHNTYDQDEVECVITNIDDPEKILIKNY